MGFEAAYPELWIGHSSWLMLAAAVALLIHSGIVTFRAMETPRQNKHLVGLTAGSMLGVGALAGSFFLLLLLAVMTVFRNDCFFCAIDRPDMALVGEVLITCVVVAGLGAASLLLHRIMSSRPLLRNALVSLMIPLAFVAWIALVLMSNSTYLGKYCQPAPSIESSATTPDGDNH